MAMALSLSNALTICTAQADPAGVHAAAAALQGWLTETACPAGGLAVNLANVTGSAAAPPTSCLALGPGAAAILAPGFHFPAAAKGVESFALAQSGAYYVATGDPDDTGVNRRGTFYAALEVAERVGVRFLASDATAVRPDAKACKLPDFAAAGLPTDAPFHFTPPLEYRQVLAWDPNQHPAFAQTQRCNGPGASLSAGGVVYASPPGFVHTSYHLLADAAATPLATGKWDTHNEWFWPRRDADPTNGTAYGQLCWSNASLVEFVTRRVLAMLRAQPDATVISVSQNDNYGFCNSSAEQAIYADEGGARIGPLLRAVNQIADAVAKAFPARPVAVDTLAYQWTRGAPARTVPRSNVIVRLCSIECNFGAPLTDPSNSAFQTDIVNWGQISNRTWIWNYVTDFANYVMPWPDYHSLGPNTVFYLKHGVRGIFQEAAYQSYGSDLAPLKTYVMSRLLWDPAGTDVAATVAEFNALYYGKTVAPRIASYMRLWSDAVEDTRFYLGESVPYDAAYLSPDFLLASAALTEPRPGDGSDAAQAARLRAAKLPTLYVMLLRWDEVRAFAAAHKVAWPYTETALGDAFAAFAQIYNETGATLLSESGHDLAWLKATAKVPGSDTTRET